MKKRRLRTDIRELSVSTFDPLGAYVAIRKKFPSESFFLESLEGTEKTARYSFIGFNPVFTFKSKGKTAEYDGKKERCENPYELLRKLFFSFDAGTVNFLPFSGGMFGYFSYDIVRFFEKLPSTLPDDLGLPDAHFMIPSQVVCFDHLKRKVFLLSHERENGIESLLNERHEGGTGKVSIGNVKPKMEKKEYEKAVEKALSYIKKGDIFQVVLSRRMEAGYEGDAFDIYRALRAINPSPYLFYLDFSETKIIGSSPEMLARLENGVLTTRPLAGTRPRSADPEKDEKLKVDMLLDEKERAEHVMLVDLHRNDMGRVSEYGSVKVDELMGIEKYSHVQHMVSNVTSRLRKDLDCFDALRSCFPAGTVSGAPKVRAMEIIEELEKGRRGPYAGSVGYFDFSGNMNFAINIRTMFTKGKRVCLQAAAGIVADSVPEREFEETENKMVAMIKSLEGKGA